MATDWNKFRQGRRAFHAYKLLVENPYEVNTSEWKCWREGWISESLASAE